MADRSRRQTVWLHQNVTLVIEDALSGVASQESTDIGNLFATKFGMSLVGVTLIRSWLRGWWTASVAASTPIWLRYTVALLKAPKGMDDGDFPDIGSHDGDAQLFDDRQLLETIVQDDVLFPRTEHLAGAGIYVESRSQRKMARIDDTMWLVGQKSTITENDITLRSTLTTLWKLP